MEKTVIVPGILSVIGDSSYVDYFKNMEALKSFLSDTSREIKETVIVLAELDKENRTGFTGVPVALSYAYENPTHSVVLTSFMPALELSKIVKEFNFFAILDNAYFERLPMSMSHLDKLFKQVPVSGEVLNNSLVQLIREVDHIIKPMLESDNADTSINNIARSKKLVFKILTKYYPTLEGLSGRELGVRINELSDGFDRPQVMKGHKLSGVFCDIEGTLVKDQIVQDVILNQLKKYEKSGKAITLWTDGNISELSVLLKSQDVHYPLKSKAEFAGAIVEIAIDNDPLGDFQRKTHISPEEFLHVK